MRHEFYGQQDWPTNVVMPAGAQSAAEIIVGSLFAVSVLWGIANIIRHRKPALLICMLGGLAACVLETHTMYMMKFFYPQEGQHVFLTGFGRPIPIYLALMYSCFFGLFNYLYMRSPVVTQFSNRAFILGWGALFIAEAILEWVCINTGLWGYFDDQPFVIYGFPIYVAIIVGAMSVILGAISRIWFDRVQGPQQWWMLLLLPVILIATFEVFTFPVALGLTAEGGINAARLGGAISIALSVAGSYVALRALASIPNRNAQLPV